jgi:hypothetical protein
MYTVGDVRVPVVPYSKTYAAQSALRWRGYEAVIFGADAGAC